MTSLTEIELLVLFAGAVLGVGGYFGTKFLQKQIDRIVNRFGLSRPKWPRG